MRGRTNIAGGGMNLNAEVHEFTVASGKNVVSGDFVEYFTTKSESTLSYMNIQQGKTEQISESLVITQSGETIYLMDMTGGNLNIASAYSEKPVAGFCMMENGGIAVATKDAPYLVKLVVNKNLLEVSAEAKNVGVKINNVKGVEEKDGKIYVIGSQTEDASSAVTYHCALLYSFTEDLSGNILLENDTPITVSFGQLKYGYMEGTFFAGGHIFCYITIANYRRSLLGKISLDSSGEKWGAEKIDIDYDPNTLFPISFWNKYIIFSAGGVLSILNAQSNEIKKIDMSGIGFPVTSDSDLKNNIRIAYAKYEDDKLAIFFNGGGAGFLSVSVFKVWNSGNIELISNIFNVEYESASFETADMYLFFIQNTVNPTCYFNNATRCRAIIYNPDSQELTDTVKIGYVKPYDGGANAIGVAKQSGKSGQTIEVYVAKPSE